MKIAAISYYIPENQVTVEELMNTVTADDLPLAFKSREEYVAFIKDELKVDAVRVENRLNDEQMLINVVEEIFMNNDIQPEDVDMIIVAQEHDQRTRENLGQFVQYEFELNNAVVFNIAGNHCANIDYALTVASEIGNNNDEIKNILIIGNVKIAEPAKRLVGTYGLLSDGSGAMLLSKGTRGYGLKTSRILSAGKLYNVDLNRDDSLLLFKYYTKCLHGLLEKSAVAPSGIKTIITQNANLLLVTQSLGAVGLDAGLIFSDNKTRYAHLDCLDFLINLKDAIYTDGKQVDKGLILAFGTGWAGSFISSLLSFD